MVRACNCSYIALKVTPFVVVVRDNLLDNVALCAVCTTPHSIFTLL